MIETELGIPVFPNLRTSWHFDDKIAQAYLLEALEIPRPDTWIFWSREDAEAWAGSASYPVVAKLACGAGSSNVRLIRDSYAARAWIRRLFSRSGVFPSMTYPAGSSRLRRSMHHVGRFLRRCAAAPSYVVLNRGTPLPRQFWQPQKNYVLFQEFLPENEWDTRITVVGHRAFGFRRMNRPDDFRASGSGVFEVDTDQIDRRCVELAFESSEKLRGAVGGV